MDDDIFNMQVRKFLKNVGITAQREIEAAVREALAAGTLKGDETVTARVVLTVESLGLNKVIDGDIDLV